MDIRIAREKMMKIELYSFKDIVTVIILKSINVFVNIKCTCFVSEKWKNQICVKPSNSKYSNTS